ncbi:MAG: preprotein translocase subunit SecA [Elusimicrobia bacterium]|nr:preprotein translocase subunit SecA [Elusimicrobiota bacterium]MBD3412588.1 preprotein translocase subunit SecA [Elusimicrobiota bacterium]
MITKLFQSIFGTHNERVLKKMNPLLNEINALEPSISSLSDDDLKNKTVYFRERLEQGATLDDILVEAFAVVREAAKRTIAMRHFDVQIIGGIVLYQGKIAEMRTGEGKTLVATLPVYLYGLTGKGVHVVTVNDYLAKRDSEWMGPVYQFLGLSVSSIHHDMSPPERQKAYACDVTYVTNNELGFDYLRDNMVVRGEDRVLRTFHYAIIDEVDSILIDEARTPLIISGPAEESTNKYYIINRIVPMLKGRFVTEKEEIEAKYKNLNLAEGFDYLVDEKAHSATLTEQGVAKCEKLLGVKNLYDDIQSEWVHHINQALRAHNLFKRDVDYVIKDGQVVIVDEFTGRLMPGRRWSEGLHQAVEAKENLRIAEENQTLATVTFQNLFKIFPKLAGMTGTALTEAPEFWEIYRLEVLEIPTNKPMIRVDHPDIIYRTEREKYTAIINEIEDNWKQGIPMLVGTRSIEKNEKLSNMLKNRGIPHQVLNAKYHEMEAQIIAQAGRKAAITIATNMAGRGTDIVLGGNPPDAAQAEEIKKLGGLHVIGTERHEARRIDNQLRGRTGRQGDPGSSRFYLALDDELMRLFGSDRIAGIMERLGMKEGEDIQHPWISRAIESAQRRVEGMNFDIRKQLIEYDKVMSKQREAIYDLRNDILDGKDVAQQVKDMLNESINEKIDQWTPQSVYPEKWDISALNAWLKRTFNQIIDLPKEELVKKNHDDMLQDVSALVSQAYRKREEELGVETIRYLERMVLLQMIDHSWKDHLYDLDQLRRGVGWRAYGQKDPIIEFKHESFRLFSQMMNRIREQTLEYIFRIQIAPQVSQRKPVQTSEQRPSAPIISNRSTTQPALTKHKHQAEKPVTPHQVPKKIGRNDPCPCGSGKKYKKCCGR